MKTVCERNQCAGCMACIEICPKDAIEIRDELSHYQAVIWEDLCIGCNACHCVCQCNHPAEKSPSIQWYQGWAEDSDLRAGSSSGGAAAAISAAFVEAGGCVCSCVFRDGSFVFEFAESAGETRKFAGSKYVKSNPVGAYRETVARLKQGQKVLFIGLPCQVSAMRNFVGKQLKQRLYTVDLICHGTPSPKLLGYFLEEHGGSLSDLKDIRFRSKAKFQVYGDGKGIITNGVTDRYSIAFLNSLIYTENCYHCTYATRERVSDLTLGDSWGSDLPMDIQKKGVSLMLCQTEKGAKLLEMAQLHLETVDIEQAIQNNHQLMHPSTMPKSREIFFQVLETKGFHALVSKALPKQCLRQDVKQLLIKTKLLRRD